MSILPEVEEAKPQFHPSFDDEDADTVLSSNDHMLFRLPRVTLRKSSGYFRNIFDSSKGKDSEPPEHKIPFPTIPLERVLCLISGLPVPIEKLSFSEIEAMVDVMQYLDIPGPLSTIRVSVTRQFRNEPISAYGLAVKMGWDDVAQQAAEMTLPLTIFSSNNSNSSTQLSHLPSSSSLLSLLHLHQRRKNLFRDQLHSRSQFQMTCRICCDPTYWRLFIARLIDELDRDCSGQAILAPSGLEEWNETKKCWERCPCKDQRCDYRHGTANKVATLKKIRSIVKGLPKDLQSFN